MKTFKCTYYFYSEGKKVFKDVSTWNYSYKVLLIDALKPAYVFLTIDGADVSEMDKEQLHLYIKLLR